MVEVKGFKEGLEDVVAADSAICYIDGTKGILSYRGIDIHDLAENSTFEEVCYLLWEGRLPRLIRLRWNSSRRGERFSATARRWLRCSAASAAT